MVAFATPPDDNNRDVMEEILNHPPYTLVLNAGALYLLICNMQVSLRQQDKNTEAAKAVRMVVESIIANMLLSEQAKAELRKGFDPVNEIIFPDGTSTITVHKGAP